MQLSNDELYDALLNAGVHEDTIDEMTEAQRLARLEQLTK